MHNFEQGRMPDALNVRPSTTPAETLSVDYIEQARSTTIAFSTPLERSQQSEIPEHWATTDVTQQPITTEDTSGAPPENRWKVAPIAMKVAQISILTVTGIVGGMQVAAVALVGGAIVFELCHTLRPQADMPLDLPSNTVEDDPSSLVDELSSRIQRVATAVTTTARTLVQVARERQEGTIADRIAALPSEGLLAPTPTAETTAVANSNLSGVWANHTPTTEPAVTRVGYHMMHTDDLRTSFDFEVKTLDLSDLRVVFRIEWFLWSLGKRFPKGHGWHLRLQWPFQNSNVHSNTEVGRTAGVDYFQTNLTVMLPDNTPILDTPRFQIGWHYDKDMPHSWDTLFCNLSLANDLYVEKNPVKFKGGVGLTVFHLLSEFKRKLEEPEQKLPMNSRPSIWSFELPPDENTPPANLELATPDLWSSLTTSAVWGSVMYIGGAGLALMIVGFGGTTYLMTLRFHLKAKQLFARNASLLILRGLGPFFFLPAVFIRWADFVISVVGFDLRGKMMPVFYASDRALARWEPRVSGKPWIMVGKVLGAGLYLLTAGFIASGVSVLMKDSRTVLLFVGTTTLVVVTGRDLRQWIIQDPKKANTLP